ncbi:DNA-3-methyladenine glycosylase [Fulvivirgaceae bacterium BMA12]|uniref:DNA-3-methyladenine glycosylase II n=1 Tax=Agaribacillus aureus TaxID=3051825 RepID=A0ABT8KYL3_9BACT|nr:DNA-3-methyladenine glycosylase [Fulvivirgaceae bacterium BMA12]
MTTIKIKPPEIFNYEECLWFLDRGFDDCLHQINKNTITKALKIQNNLFLVSIRYEGTLLSIQILQGNPSAKEGELIKSYISQWFDLYTDLEKFYKIANKDPVLKPLIKKYWGLRLIGIEDLFEALCWAIIGQQINLSFAYKTKRALVENYGRTIEHNGTSHYLFPTPDTLSNCSVEALKKLQFSRNKAQYLISLAKDFRDGIISKDQLMALDSKENMLTRLTNLKGVGAWTANYAMMKCLKIPTAFPIQDVGLHNALKQQLGLKEKPTLESIQQLAKNWKNWEGYATLYLWRSLV